MPAGGQQNAREQTLAQPPSSSKATPDLPPGFAASSTHSSAHAQSGHLMPRSSSSPFGVVRPCVPTLALEALLGSGPQSAASQQAQQAVAPVSASSVGQSAYQQRPPGFGPSRPQRTPTPEPSRGSLPQAADRPPGFGTVPVPQSLGSPQLGGSSHAPSSFSSSAHMSSQLQSQHDRPHSHQASDHVLVLVLHHMFCLRNNKRLHASDWIHKLAVARDVLECATFHNRLP